MWGPKWSWGWLPDSTTFAMHEKSSNDQSTMSRLSLLRRFAVPCSRGFGLREAMAREYSPVTRSPRLVQSRKAHRRRRIPAIDMPRLDLCEIFHQARTSLRSSSGYRKSGGPSSVWFSHCWASLHASHVSLHVPNGDLLELERLVA